jgi:hypothetical protein
MESLIGLILSLVVAGFAIIVGIDRDRSFIRPCSSGKSHGANMRFPRRVNLPSLTRESRIDVHPDWLSK